MKGKMIISDLYTLKQLIIGTEQPLFVRWSRGFSSDSRQPASRDGLTGEMHSGLSAVEIDPEWSTDDEWLARRMTEYRFLRMKDSHIGCHIYTGRIVGQDSDGYESIAEFEPVASLSENLIDELLRIKN